MVRARPPSFSPTPNLRQSFVHRGRVDLKRGGRATIASVMAKPPVVAELRWTEGLRFDVMSARIKTIVDGDSTAGASPVQMLVIGLAACMAADVVDIVRKG